MSLDRDTGHIYFMQLFVFTYIGLGIIRKNYTAFIHGVQMKQVSLLMIFLVALSSLFNVASAESAESAPKNIIMIVGDGMGPAYTTAYRMYADDPATPEVERTVFDRMLVGMASTHSTTGYVTDSAAGATALSTGVKTYNGAIAVDDAKESLPTVLEFAKQQGRRTGIAVTSQVNHATPAGFSAHNESRHNYNEIADSYFDRKVNDEFVLDVMLGGGWKYFIREDRDLTKEFVGAGYQYIDNPAELHSLKKEKPALGLFADEGLPWALDTAGNARLKALAKTAVRLLENDKGFFLLVEASQVDWAGHANDVASAMAEMHDFALALEWLEEYVENRSDTLMVVTADHSTGGFTIGANKVYQWDPEPLKNLKASPQAISHVLMNAPNRVDVAADMLGLTLTEAEQAQLTSIETDDVRILQQALHHILDQRSHTGWTTGGHTGVDVQIFAKGLGKEKFVGYMDNTQIAKNVFELLKSHIE